MYRVLVLWLAHGTTQQRQGGGASGRFDISGSSEWKGIVDADLGAMGKSASGVET